MTRAVSASPLGSEFNDFLFSSLGEDRNGMRLSVVSALARLDVDPWLEAAQLARLTRANAQQRFASLIGLLPPELPVHEHLDAIAARLVALLPFRTEVGGVPLEARADGQMVVNFLIVLYMSFTLVTLGVEWTAEGHQPAAQYIAPEAPASEQGLAKPMPDSKLVTNGKSPRWATKHA